MKKDFNKNEVMKAGVLSFPKGSHPKDAKYAPQADISGIKNKYLDISYANISESQKLDLYLPDDGEGPFPLIVHIHGGAFAVCDKRDVQVIPWLDAINRGFALASINYRMSGEAIFPAAVIDCKAAIRYLRGKAEKYKLDKSRFAAVGGSAGGNLTEMVCVTGNVAELSDASLGHAGESCGVQAGVSWFGPTDFLKMDEQFTVSGTGERTHNDPNSPESCYMGGTITKLDYEWVQMANPITHIHKDIPPMYLQHGSVDRIVPVEQSKIFAFAVEHKLGPGRVKFEILEGADHADAMFETKENMEKNFEFLQKHLNSN